MALPQLNTATYELELPSTGKTVKYRPFLVKEQKILMIAQESEDDKQIEKAFADIISSCTFGKLKPYEMPLFDIEYIFLKLRGKSVGEKVTLNVLCPDDEKTRVDVNINLEDVGVLTNDDHTNEVELTKDIKIIMKYPTLSDMTEFDKKGEVLVIFEMIKNCIQEIHSGTEIYNSVDISSKELDEFIDSLNSVQFKMIKEFFDTMPTLKHTVKYKCDTCGEEKETLLQGLNSFFG